MSFPEDWELNKLEDCMDAIIDYRGKTPEKTTFGIPLITAKVVKGGRIETPDEFIAVEDYDQWMRRGLLKKGDVLVTTEAPLGEVAQIDNPKVALAQRLIALRGKVGKLDSTFLKFLMQSEFVQAQLSARASGTTVSGIKQSELRKVELPLPPVPEQRAIACILGALDDKIELNRKRCRTLEAMARAIFQSWFVDFDPVKAKAAVRREHPRWTDAQVSRAACPKLKPEIAALFPDSFEDSPLGPIPKGWRVGTVGEVAEIRGGTQLPTEKRLQNGRYAVFGANGVMGYSNESTHNGFVIAFGRVGAYCGSVHWSLDGAWINNNASSVTPLKWPALVLQSILEFDFTTMRTGSAQPFIPNSSLAAASIVIPEPMIADVYEAVAFPIRQEQGSLEGESRTLAALRDALLPKLISGELRVPDAERIVGRAT